MRGGTPAGAHRPTQPSTWKFGTPASMNVGRSGSGAERFDVVCASAFRRPLFTKGSDEGGVANEIWASLPITLTIAGPPPLYGTLMISTPVVNLNSSPARC